SCSTSETTPWSRRAFAKQRAVAIHSWASRSKQNLRRAGPGSSAASRGRASRNPHNNYVPVPDLALDDRGDAHAAGRADGDQGAAGAALGELLRGGHDDARAGRGERMAERDARALGIELRAVDRAERRVAAEAIAAVVVRLPALERAEDLGGEGFMDLVDVEILELQ